MTLSLIALTGPLKGQTFGLEADAMTIGRHRDNQLRIPDLAVSRHHCRLHRTGDPATDGWCLEDLGSRDGTFVNGRPVREAKLASGDMILICNSTFLLTPREAQGGDVGEVANPPANGVVLSDRVVFSDGETATALRFAIDDSAFLDPDKVRVLATERRLARSFSLLLEMGVQATTSRRTEALAEASLEQILKMVPAERAVFLRMEGAEAVPVAQRLASTSSAASTSPPISRTVIERVVQDHQALMWNATEAALLDAESVTGTGLRSLACVPLIHRGQVLGVIYLDSRSLDSALVEEHRDLLAAMAAMVSPALDNALYVEGLERENTRLQTAELGHGLIGESPVMKRVFTILTRAAQSSSTILILGESGTGKELAARAVHSASPRLMGPFVAINCATLSDNLLESELFGHEKGAFTGAVARKIGKLEVAEGGTLFLDEVGELPLSIQAKLLRVLQEKTFERVGGTRPIQGDVRILAATNRDLARAIQEGGFREDLFYRLNVISVTLPPLRQRREDIPLLATHFAAIHGQQIRGHAVTLSPETRAVLAAYDWPGNVRELTNALERAVVLGQDDVVHPEDLPETLLESDATVAVAGTNFHENLNALKKRLILEAVRSADGKITRAAEQLGLHANHLHRLITSLGLRQELGK